jgi:hypothetical protein
MNWPYLTTGCPAAMALRASLWPRGTRSLNVTPSTVTGLQNPHSGCNIVGIIKPDGIGGGHG